MNTSSRPWPSSAIEPSTRSEWTVVERPYRAFALTIPEFAEPEPSYAIRRHATGSGRKDSVVEAMAKSAARTVGSTVGREIVRGVLGSLLGGGRRR